MASKKQLIKPTEARTIPRAALERVYHMAHGAMYANEYATHDKSGVRTGVNPVVERDLEIVRQWLGLPEEG